jgi:hypothetical protein
MKSILDHYKPISSAFTPATADELVALRLAQNLGDAPAARHYAALLDEHSESRLLVAFKRTMKSGQRTGLARRFHTELEQGYANIGEANGLTLVSLRVERRSVAAAVFKGNRLEYTEVRQLSSVKEKARASAIGFVRWFADNFHLDMAAIESIETGDEFQRAVLQEAIEATLREAVIPIWSVSKPDLFAAYSYPPLRSRRELRKVITSIWPVLDGARTKVFIQDAAALGLYVQIERHFIIN